MGNADFRHEISFRCKGFAKAVINMGEAFHHGSPIAAQVIYKQLVRSATSVGANYTEACHARSSADFISKLKICEAEAAESRYWLELFLESNLIHPQETEELIGEASRLTALFTKCTLTARRQH